MELEKQGVLPPRLTGPKGAILPGPIERDPAGGYRIQQPIPSLVPGSDVSITQAVRDDAYTLSRHTLGGAQVARDLRRGREAHVFNEGVDLARLEAEVWARGSAGGMIRDAERFSVTFDQPIGRRIQAGRPDVPLRTVEIKGRLDPVMNVWKYHLVPRPRPAR